LVGQIQADGAVILGRIGHLMSRQQELAKSPNPDDKKKALFLALDVSIKPDASSQQQEAGRKAMVITMRKLRDDVESMRKQLLNPVDSQETEVLSSINQAYGRLEYANSIVTENIASIYKFHQAQGDLLKAFGVDRDLGQKIGEKLSMASDKVACLVNVAENSGDKITNAEETAKKIRDEVCNLGIGLINKQ
jgi:hypothetical protein